MTTTNAISGQSIGTGSNVGEGKFPQKVTIAATTTAFVITPRVTNGAGEYIEASEVIIWYSGSSYSVTAAAAPELLRKTARFVSVKPSRNSSVAIAIDSSIEPVTGSYIYLWCSIPTVTVAQTLDVNVVELP